MGVTKEEQLLLNLIRAAIVGDTGFDIPIDVDWQKVIDLSFDQGVASISVDGYNHWLGAGDGSDCALESEELEDLKFEWFGSVLQDEEDYRNYTQAIKDYVQLLSVKGIKTLLLKGYGLGLNYPVPSHRPVGDIDTYHFSQWKEVDDIVRGMGVNIDYSHPHHSVFQFEGFTVENHYDIVNVEATRDGRYTDEILKKLARESAADSRSAIDCLFPSPTFNAIFLLKHAGAHFSGDCITLRHLLDWALYVDRYSSEIDWQTVREESRRMGNERFLQCLNELSTECIGIDHAKFPLEAPDSVLKEKVLKDILGPSFPEKLDSNGCSAFIFKLRRLKANMWKRKLVNNEPVIPMLIRLAFSHINNNVND